MDRFISVLHWEPDLCLCTYRTVCKELTVILKFQLAPYIVSLSTLFAVYTPVFRLHGPDQYWCCFQVSRKCAQDVAHVTIGRHVSSHFHKHRKAESRLNYSGFFNKGGIQSPFKSTSQPEQYLARISLVVYKCYSCSLSNSKPPLQTQLTNPTTYSSIEAWFV